jgi:transposase
MRVKPIQLPPLSTEQVNELNELYRKTRDPRFKTRAQIILLAAEKQLVAQEIGEIVRLSDQAVRKWLKRYTAEGIEGLKDMPRAGAPQKVTANYLEHLEAAVRRRPRSLDLPFSLWTLQRLADYMAEETGLRVEAETVRIHLKKLDIVLSRPQHKVSSPDPEYSVKKRRLKTHETT